jgi:DNA gyrase subunit A
MTRAGLVLRAPLEQVRETGRSAVGVKLINLSEHDEVVGVTLMTAAEIVVAEAGEGSDGSDGESSTPAESPAR